MPTHAVSVTLSTSAYKVLQKLIASGHYQSEDEAIEEAVFELEFAVAQGVGSENLAAWQEEEIKAAYDEDRAHPERALSSEEVDAYLAFQRGKDTELAKAS